MRESTDKKRILILLPTAAGDRMAGPEIRSWELAQALASDFQVTVSTSHPPHRPPTSRVRIIPSSRRQVVRSVVAHDVVLAPWIPPFLIPLLLARKVVLVSDLYDPIERELSRPTTPAAARELDNAAALTRLQLRFSTIVVCGSARQRRDLLERAFATDPSRKTAALVVPFGIPSDAPRRSCKQSFRSSLGLAGADVVVLWWGSIWRWFDAETAVRAASLAAEEDPRIKLVLSSGPPPLKETHKLLTVDKARSVARELGALDRTVFFFDSWIPYAARGGYLLDADIGLTLHADADESHLAVRARYLDYLWAGLPCVLSRGDELADRLGAMGLARLVPAGSARAAAKAIVELAADAAGRTRARQVSGSLAADYTWDRLARPLTMALRQTESSGPRHRALPAAAAAAGYYLRRISHRGRDRLAPPR